MIKIATKQHYANKPYNSNDSPHPLTINRMPNNPQVYYLKPAKQKVTYAERIETKKAKLRELASTWRTIPEAYRLIIENPGLILKLSEAEAIDFYSRVNLYARETQKGQKIPYNAPEIIFDKIITHHPTLNKNPEETRAKLKHTADYTPLALFISGTKYHERNSKLGARLEERVQPNQRSPKRKKIRGCSYRDGKATGKGLGALA